MRELKFRAWNKIRKVMSYDVTLYANGWVECVFEDGSEDKFPPRIAKEILVIMQYVGLKDKNGKEIYEGDVLKNDYGDLWVVVWKGTGFMLALNGESKNIYSANEYYFSSCEVIGNIYENPELLKS